ncbi:hypothetical protein P9112_006241 [Eukaryota sp. TZLM1-RC]
MKPAKPQPSLSHSEFAALLEGLEDSNMTADVSGIKQNCLTAIELVMADSVDFDRNLVLTFSSDHFPASRTRDKTSFFIFANFITLPTHFL